VTKHSWNIPRLSYEDQGTKNIGRRIRTRTQRLRRRTDPTSGGDAKIDRLGMNATNDMSSNTDGTTYRAGLASNMSAFDQLPKLLRQALAQSDHNWSARQILRWLRGKKATTAVIIAKIKKEDADKNRLSRTSA
jgi:Family of unknown function (DUF6525)